jgi:hypothetical protein
MSTLTGTPTDAASMPPGFQVRAEPQELTLEKLVAGATIYDLPIRGFAHVFDAMKEIFELSWERWPPTIWVNQIPRRRRRLRRESSADRHDVRHGLRPRLPPGVPVNLKWNNAWGIPGHVRPASRRRPRLARPLLAHPAPHGPSARRQGSGSGSRTISSSSSRSSAARTARSSSRTTTARSRRTSCGSGFPSSGLSAMSAGRLRRSRRLAAPKP